MNTNRQIVDDWARNFEWSEFALGYLECALWSSTNDDGEPLDSYLGLEDFDPTALQTLLIDVEDWLLAQKIPPEYSYHKFGHDLYGYSQFGHDFWLSRNGHGAGFFDRGSEAHWKKLQEAARIYREVNLYIGDDGKIYA